ncbi:zinc-ribbon domain protein [uncultured archaeon]|nr:zinc-ribbon domain protein [uncultured archaeon]
MSEKGMRNVCGDDSIIKRIQERAAKTRAARHQKICSHCHNEIDEDSKTCPICRHPLLPVRRCDCGRDMVWNPGEAVYKCTKGHTKGYDK